MTAKHVQFIKTKWFLGVVCALLGAAIVLGVRFATYRVDSIHYHANFALYINGQRQEFKGAQYYTEVEMCTLDTTMTPTGRAHMHDNVSNVVHVEDHAVTWGQFFTNLGWTLGPTFIASPEGVLYDQHDQAKLHFVINGQDYTNLGGLQNTVIKDQDKLLVSFGDETSAALNQQYNAIPSTAKKYDTTKDPASCSGGHSATMHDRFVHMF